MARLAAASAGPVSRVGEPYDGAQGDGVVGVGEVAQDAAGRDGGELLVVADEAHAGPARERVPDDGVEVERGGHAGFIDDEQGVGTDGGEPFRAGSSAGAGGPPRVSVSWTSLAMVSVGAPRSSASTSAAPAVGASPMTVPPLLRQAVASAAMAVVFPVPAGAKASWTRAPEVAISRTSATCPALSARPWLASDSSSAKPMLVSSTVRPSRNAAAAMMRRSAAMMSALV